MKYLKNFLLYESVNNIPGEISIEEYIEEVLPQFEDEKKEVFCNWWNENRKDYKIYFFNFNTKAPIMGGIIHENGLAINHIIKRLPPHMRIFLPLHESRHLDQQAKNDFMSGYFDSVVNKNFPLFIETYRRLEKDANDFAFEVMEQLNLYINNIKTEERLIRGNEFAADQVYAMMQRDIMKTGAEDFFELIKSQIL